MHHTRFAKIVICSKTMSLPNSCLKQTWKQRYYQQNRSLCFYSSALNQIVAKYISTYNIFQNILQIYLSELLDVCALTSKTTGATTLKCKENTCASHTTRTTTAIKTNTWISITHTHFKTALNEKDCLETTYF